jgi:hypothetical protein
MGGGVSGLHTLIASGPASNSGLREALGAYERRVLPLLMEVALDDAMLLNDEMTAEAKNYHKIIDHVMNKSKMQLHRLAEAYRKHEYVGGCPTGSLPEDIGKTIHGAFGDFLRSLFLTRFEFNLEHLELALSGLGCDYDIIIDVLCTSSRSDIMDLRDVLTTTSSDTPVSIATITSKTKMDPTLQRFIVQAIFGKREEEGQRDVGVAAPQAEALLRMSKAADGNAVLEMLLRTSRSQCEAIDEVLRSSFSSSLEAVIRASLRPRCARALHLWTAPLRRAVIECLWYALHETTYHEDDHISAVTRIISSIDKVTMCSIEEDYEAAFKERLSEGVSALLGGYIKEAVMAYLTAPVFDEGIEHKLIEALSANGGAVFVLSGQSEEIAHLSDLVAEEQRAVELYLQRTREDTVQAKNSLLKKFGHETSLSSNLCLNTIDVDLTNNDHAFHMDQRMDQHMDQHMDRTGHSPADEKESGVTSDQFAIPKGRVSEKSNGSDGAQAADDNTETSQSNTDNKSSSNSIDGQLAAPPSLSAYLSKEFSRHYPDQDGSISVRQFWNIVHDTFYHVFTEEDMTRVQVRCIHTLCLCVLIVLR